MAKRGAKRPPKVEGVLELARELWAEGSFVIMSHAIERQDERAVLDPEIGWVIEHGYHEKRKDEFKPEFNAWNYALRGKTLDERNLRVAVSFEALGSDEAVLLIITVIDLELEDDS